MPSAADESTVFGCLYAGYQELASRRTSGSSSSRARSSPKPLQPLTHLYLGTSTSDEDLERYIAAHPEVAQRYRITKPKNLTEVLADILANGGIIARASGAMEWGARGLGNRSIIADPRSTESVRIINEMIKNRDFWMPFAPSVLEEDFPRYFKARKQDFSPYMIFGFDATPAGTQDLRAALHAYDFSGRPQVVRKSWNPEYYRLITAFKKKTGVGGVLNTSFNLHGHPVARTVSDAFEVMENSSLPHLTIGSYLISRQ
jgi:carbamoyltransferase